MKKSKNENYKNILLKINWITLLNDEPSNPFAKKFLRKYKLLSIDSNCKKIITNIFTKVQENYKQFIDNKSIMYGRVDFFVKK